MTFESPSRHRTQVQVRFLVGALLHASVDKTAKSPGRKPGGGAVPRFCSSVGESTCLKSRGSTVQVRPEPQTKHGSVAQSGRAPPRHGEGHRFKSCSIHVAKDTCSGGPVRGPYGRLGREPVPFARCSVTFPGSIRDQHGVRRALADATQLPAADEVSPGPLGWVRQRQTASFTRRYARVRVPPHPRLETLSIGELTRLERGRSNGRAGSNPVVSATLEQSVMPPRTNG